jgi:hypothetical protein
MLADRVHHEEFEFHKTVVNSDLFARQIQSGLR